MVRPAHRRPGQSRKAQYGLFAAYVIAVTGAVAGLLLAILSVVDPIGFAQLRVASPEITAPIARVTRSVTGSLSGIDYSVGAYVGAGTQNRRLGKEVAARSGKSRVGQEWVRTFRYCGSPHLSKKKITASHK